MSVGIVNNLDLFPGNLSRGNAKTKDPFQPTKVMK